MVFYKLSKLKWVRVGVIDTLLRISGRILEIY